MDAKLREFVSVAKRLKAMGLVSDGVNKGSLSYRISDDTFLVTPSKMSYDDLTVDDVNIMKTDGSFVRQPSPISRDSYFHIEIYNARNDVNAIIHTHSNYATALGLASKRIPFIIYGMKFHCGGPVEVAPFALPNSVECNQKIIKHLGKRKAVILENHGLVSVGRTITDCYETAEFVEALSESYIHALQIGPVAEITLGKEDTYGET